MPHDIILRFHPLEPYYPNISDYRVECTMCTHPITKNGENYTATEYAFTYEANAAIACCWSAFPTSTCLGYHLGDLEKIIILDDQFGNHCFVFFKAHGTGEGMWLPYYECEINENQEIIFYVARGSHGFYPHAGVYWRILGIANDLCSDEGEQYRIKVVGQHTEYYSPTVDSITPWQRFLIPFSLPIINERRSNRLT
jgi:hypothetical protein